jgi:hypothetical protein
MTSTTQDTYPEFPVKVFIDSNVVLECLPLAQLPWCEIDAAGPILLLVSHSTLREIDSKKQAGRLSQYARAFNQLIAPIAQHGGPVVVTEGPPRVCVMAAQSERIDWDQYDDLNREDVDTRIIAEILHARGVPAASRLYLSQDTNALIVAGRHGLRTKRVPDHWLRAPESPEKDKEIRRLKARIEVLEKAEPSFAIEMEAPAPPVTVYAVEPLSEAEANDLVTRILQAHPKATQATGLFDQMNYDSTLDRRYAEYETKRVPAFARRLHQVLETCFGQVPFSLTVTNAGEVRADNLVVEIAVAGGWINAKPIMPLTGGPRVPRLQPFDPMRHIRDLGSLPLYGVATDQTRHEVHLDPPKRSASFTAQCKDFRHGQKWTFDGVLWLDPRYARDAVVNVRVTAANLHGDKQEHFPVPKAVETVKPADLLEFETGRLRRVAHITPLLEKYLMEKSYSKYDIDDEDWEA